MCNTLNIVDEVNRRILNFVQQEENRRLLPATGYFSTPFRGNLFGYEHSAAVAQELHGGRTADVLWLGTNPGMARSLDYIENPPNGQGDFGTFMLQMQSGFFGSRLWDAAGQPSLDFNPIDSPQRNWRLYRDVLARITNPQSVAFANFIPWGSGDARQLLSSCHPALLNRMLIFSDGINLEIVKALKPNLILVPLSLRRVLRRIAAAMDADGPTHQINMSGQPFSFSTGRWQRDCLNVAAAYLPHPVSLRVPGHDRGQFVDGVAAVLAAILR